MDLRKQINFLLEDQKHEFGCAMLFFDFPQMEEIHSLIDENDLYIDDEDSSFGLETEPHCTLLWGLHDNVTTDELKGIVNNEDFNFHQQFLGYNISLFDTNPTYDVLKLDVGYKRKGNPILTKCNKKLSSLPHESTEFDYHPHMTIAYLKKGMGKKYIEKFKGNQFDLQPSYIGYSKTDGSLDKIKI